MAEVKIKVEIQDTNGSLRTRAVLAVPDDITRDELVGALKQQYPDLAKDKLAISVDWHDNKPATGKFLAEGDLVFVKPRSSGVRFLGEEKA